MYMQNSRGPSRQKVLVELVAEAGHDAANAAQRSLIWVVPCTAPVSHHTYVWRGLDFRHLIVKSHHYVAMGHNLWLHFGGG